MLANNSNSCLKIVNELLKIKKEYKSKTIQINIGDNKFSFTLTNFLLKKIKKIK